MGKPLWMMDDAELERACAGVALPAAWSRWSLDREPAVRPRPHWLEAPASDVYRADRRVRSYRRLVALSGLGVRTLRDLRDVATAAEPPGGLTHWDQAAFRRALHRYRARFVDPPAPPAPRPRPRRPDLPGQLVLFADA